MKVLAQRHKYAAVFRVLLADAEAQEVAIKRPRALLIGNSKSNVTYALDFHAHPSVKLWLVVAILLQPVGAVNAKITSWAPRDSVCGLLNYAL
jgi:hypothetical protein